VAGTADLAAVCGITLGAGIAGAATAGGDIGVGVAIVLSGAVKAPAGGGPLFDSGDGANAVSGVSV